MPMSFSESFPRILIIYDIYKDLAKTVKTELKERLPEIVFTDTEAGIITCKILEFCFVSHLYAEEPNPYDKETKDIDTKSVIKKPGKPIFEHCKKLTYRDHTNIKLFFIKNRVAVTSFYNRRRNCLEQKDPKN